MRRGEGTNGSQIRKLGAGLACAAILLSPSPALALTEGAILDFVRQQAAQKYQVATTDVSVRWQGMSLEMLAPRLPENPVLKLGSVYRLAGTQPVPLHVWDKGREVAVIFPRLQVEVYQNVLVTATAIKRGQSVGSGDVRTVRRPLEAIGSQPFTSPAGLEGATALRDIAPNTILVAPMLGIPPLVRSASMVNVRLVCGGLTILTSGQALQDGRKGQMVRVSNPTSHKDYLGEVVGPDLVEVRLEEEND